ncbi:hypothetical protein [Serratia quinivorans]|uniref:hypothetical protein n=1 Tax=Serratia quinivorans TaxID=137545 RepID=UPI002178744C|nr:hypothetical protein [Serratia quinivorans]CAI0913738.1 Uncharacterised protein [Serratia quinivorans]CAI2096652.1 Uncharacterised protein [Serratia quinivorans]
MKLLALSLALLSASCFADMQTNEPVPSELGQFKCEMIRSKIVDGKSFLKEQRKDVAIITEYNAFWFDADDYQGSSGKLVYNEKYDWFESFKPTAKLELYSRQRQGKNLRYLYRTGNTILMFDNCK